MRRPSHVICTLALLTCAPAPAQEVRNPADSFEELRERYRRAALPATVVFRLDLPPGHSPTDFLVSAGGLDTIGPSSVAFDASGTATIVFDGRDRDVRAVVAPSAWSKDELRSPDLLPPTLRLPDAQVVELDPDQERYEVEFDVELGAGLEGEIGFSGDRPGWFAVRVPGETGPFSVSLDQESGRFLMPGLDPERGGAMVVSWRAGCPFCIDGRAAAVHAMGLFDLPTLTPGEVHDLGAVELVHEPVTGAVRVTLEAYQRRSPAKAVRRYQPPDVKQDAPAIVPRVHLIRVDPFQVWWTETAEPLDLRVLPALDDAGRVRAMLSVECAGYAPAGEYLLLPIDLKPTMDVLEAVRDPDGPVRQILPTVRVEAGKVTDVVVGAAEFEAMAGALREALGRAGAPPEVLEALEPAKPVAER